MEMITDFSFLFDPGDSGVSTSGNLEYRKYRSNADNYLGFSFGMGFSPEANQFNIENNVTPIITLKSQKFKIDYYFSSKTKKNAWGTQLGITHQEKSLIKEVIFGFIL